MKRILSSLLILVFTFLVISPSLVSASPSESIIITKENSQEMLNRALAGDQEVIDAVMKTQAYNKTSVQKALKKINFQDGKATHEIDFDDGSSIVIGHGPGQIIEEPSNLTTLSSSGLVRSTTSVKWPYYYKVYQAGIEWARYTVEMKYWLCTDGSSVSLDMTGTSDSVTGLYPITLTARGVTEIHSNDYYVQANGQCIVDGVMGYYTVKLECYGKYNWNDNWSRAVIQ